MRLLLRRLGPWGWILLLGQALFITRQHWRNASPADRARLTELLRRSKGRPNALSAAERQEALDLARGLRPGKLARDLFMGVIRPGRRARRRR
jgi:hypothetical protein